MGAKVVSEVAWKTSKDERKSNYIQNRLMRGTNMHMFFGSRVGSNLLSPALLGQKISRPNRLGDHSSEDALQPYRDWIGLTALWG